MKRSFTFIAILAAGCTKLPDDAPRVVTNKSPAVVQNAAQVVEHDNGTAADGALVVLHLPGMV